MTPREARFLKELAVEGVISFEEAGHLETAQEKLSAETGERKPVWEIALNEGIITSSQAERFLKKTESGPQVSIQMPEVGTTRAPAPEASREGQGSGRKLGGYELISKLGQGGMGAVYMARQEGMDRLVALKVLPRTLAKDREFIQRFMREARAAGRLSHPNIVAGIGAGFADGYYYFAMEYVEGRNLEDRLESDGPLPESEVAEYGRQIALALDHAHEAGVIHRDVKPENIMVTSEGQAKLCDLGLARRAAEDLRLTQEGLAVGTPYYISPELVRGEEPDPRADVYSLGCTLYHLVTARPPFEGEMALAVMQQHLNDTAPPVSEVLPGLSRALETAIEKMMARDREDRYETAADAAEALQEVIAGGIPPVLTATVAERRRAETSGKRRGTRLLQPVAAQEAAEEEEDTTEEIRPGRRARGGPPLRLIITIGGLLVLLAAIFALAVRSRTGEDDGPTREKAAPPGRGKSGGEAIAKSSGNLPLRTYALTLQEGGPAEATGTASYRGCKTGGGYLGADESHSANHYDGTVTTRCGDGGRWVTFVRFAVTRRGGGPLPDDAEVLEAKLCLSKKGYVPYLVLRRLTAEWKESEVSWDYAAEGSKWRTPGGDVEARPCAVCDLPAIYQAGGDPASPKAKKIWYGPWWCEFDVTESLAAALKEGRNYGWRVTAFKDASCTPGQRVPMLYFAGRLFHEDPALRPKLVLKVRCRKLETVAAPAGRKVTVKLQDGLSVGGRTYSGTRDTYLGCGDRWSVNAQHGEKEVILMLGKRYRGLVRFAVFRSEGGPVPDGAHVSSAKLCLFKSKAYPCGLRAHEILRDWDEKAVSGAETGKGSAWAEPGGDAPGRDRAARPVAECALGFGAGQWAELNVTESLRSWSSGKRSNFGWHIIDEGSDGTNNRHYCSREHRADPGRRPKLEIIYLARD